MCDIIFSTICITFLRFGGELMIKDAVIIEKNLKEESDYPFRIYIQSCIGKKIMAKAHIHDDIEMVYATEGEFDVFINGEKYSFGKGDLLIINSREVHRIIAKNEDINSYYWMRFPAEMIYSAEQSLFEIKYVLPFLLSDSTHEKVICEKKLENSGIPEAIKQLHKEYNDKNYGYELAVRINICKVFLWILRFWQEDGVNLNIDEHKSGKTAVDLSGVFSYVSENFASEITVSDMAKLCCMSYSYFSRLFSEITGQTFSEYVNFIRMREAQRLLVTTEMTVTEIAFNTGFSSSSHFISRFRKIKGITPKQFRKQFGK